MNQLVDYKNEKYHKERHTEFLRSEELNLIWSEFAFNLYFNGLKSKIKVLEFGGGLGYNLITASKFYDCCMIEPSDFGRQFAKKFGIKSFYDIPELLQNNKEKFDKILCRHVLEHLENPKETLVKLKELLKEDGELILILPYEKKKRPLNREIDYHLYCWTPRTAYNLLRSAGFNNISYKYNFFTGRRFFIPLYKLFGIKVYALFLKIFGRVFNAKELQLNVKIK
jgi:SAM-dependent methyltransferase